MMKNQLQTAPDTDQSPEMGESWNALLERIAALAHRRSKSLLTHTDDEDDAFDRGARCLRTLMSSAEVAHRLKRDVTKDTASDDQGAEGSAITESDIAAAYREVSDAVDRFEREELERRSAEAADQSESVGESAVGTGGDTLGSERP